MAPEIVIAMYRPRESGEEKLMELVREHMPALRRAELVTDRPSILCRSSDGTLLEIFEWRSSDAARRAHEEPVVARVWEAMAAVADFVSLSSLPEAGGQFPHFAPVANETSGDDPHSEAPARREVRRSAGGGYPRPDARS